VKTRAPRRKRRLRKEVKWTLSAFVIVIVLEYVVLPELGGARKSFHQIDHINLAYVFAGVLLEAAALLAYTQLTKTVLPADGPKRGRILQINLSSLAVSHVVPGGTAPGAALSYRLFTEEGVRGADAGFALAMQGVGSAVVLNVIFWLALFVSLFTHGYNPLYAVAAGAGVLMMGTFAAAVILLTRGRHRAVDLVHRLADKVPFLDGDQLASAVQRVADRLAVLYVQKDLLRRAIAWAAANWLLDAASLWVSIAAFGKFASPIDVLVAYGLANILAVIPVTPSGLGVVEGVLVPTLAGFGVKSPLLPVLLYRLWNFWLPIPVGGAAYLSLRFSDVGWIQRLRDLRNEVVEETQHGTVMPFDEMGRPIEEDSEDKSSSDKDKSSSDKSATAASSSPKTTTGDSSSEQERSRSAKSATDESPSDGERSPSDGERSPSDLSPADEPPSDRSPADEPPSDKSFSNESRSGNDSSGKDSSGKDSPDEDGVGSVGGGRASPTDGGSSADGGSQQGGRAVSGPTPKAPEPAPKAQGPATGPSGPKTAAAANDAGEEVVTSGSAAQEGYDPLQETNRPAPVKAKAPRPVPRVGAGPDRGRGPAGAPAR